MGVRDHSMCSVSGLRPRLGFMACTLEVMGQQAAVEPQNTRFAEGTQEA
jgi:hypothetical protein